MSQKPRKRYTTEFKAQAVELLVTGKPVQQVADELCIKSNLLYKWRLDSLGPQASSAGAQAEGAEADGLLALRRENAVLRQENDILKKAAVILGTRPQLSSAK